MNRESYQSIGAAIGVFVPGICLFLGYIQEITMGRRVAIPGISHDIAKWITGVDILGVNKLGWHLGKVLHSALVDLFGFSSTHALGIPLAFLCILTVIVCGIIGFLLGRFLGNRQNAK